MRAPFTIDQMEAPSAGRATGLIRFGELADGCSPLHIPVIILNGADDGPVVYLHVGSHGQETVYGMSAMRRLAQSELDPSRMKGAVVMVPGANLLAHQAATRIAPHYGVREGVPYGGDLHKLWPGDPKGSMTQRLAATIWTHIVDKANYVIDFHTNSQPGIAFALMYGGATSDQRGAAVWRQSLESARAFGLTVVKGASNPLTLVGAAMQAGKPAMTIEVPAPRILDRRYVDVAVQGVKNVLIHLGVLSGEVIPLAGISVLGGEHEILPSIRANRGGWVDYEVEPGRFLRAGTIVARIYDVFGNELEALPMEQDGYVSTFPPLSWTASQSVASGDYVADCIS
jgi:predicted deacylase